MANENIFAHFFSLIYPNVCAACGNSLYKNEYRICTYCIYHLPKTNFHKQLENPIHKIFWGRTNISNAAAYYYFNKGGRVQQLMHNLKYNSQKEVGQKVGELYGSELKLATGFNEVDMVIGVPLHPIKQKKRGYNQSDWFAKGLADSMKIEHNTEILKRITASDTQTKKSRFSRWQNVESIFSVQNISALEHKHVLLVDDVITTGATIEACANQLLKAKGTKVSVAAIACA